MAKRRKAAKPTATKTTAEKLEDPDDRILTFTEAGEMIGVHRSTVSLWARTGAIKNIVKHPSMAPGIWKSDLIKLYDYLQSLDNSTPHA